MARRQPAGLTLAPASADRLHFTGMLSAGLRFERGVLTEFDAVLEQAGFSLSGAEGEGLGFGPLDGHLPWRAREPTWAQLSIGGGHWEKLELGPFELAAEIAGSGMRLDRVRIPMLFLQGTRDEFARLDLLQPVAARLADRAELRLFPDADHSFHVPARSGRSDVDTRTELSRAIAEWMTALVTRAAG